MKNALNLKNSSIVPRERAVKLWQATSQSLRTVTMDNLISALDQYDRGYLRQAVLLWSAIKRRDDLLKVLTAKRESIPGRLGFTVDIPEGLTGAQAALARDQQALLEDFYAHLDVTDVLNLNEAGGFRLLCQQMASAIGAGFAVHEIVWRPSRSGVLRATFRFCPLQLFENTSGKLRYLQSESASLGIDMDDVNWLVTSCSPLLHASMLAWLGKNLSLQDWLDYSGQYSMPGVWGQTAASRGSAAFTDMEEALEAFLEAKAIVTSSSEDLKTVKLNDSNQPYEALISRMDHILVALWRGSDLTTISRKDGYGASVQAGESSLLEEDDAALLTETLHRQIDPTVISYRFGPDAPVLASVRLLVSPRRASSIELAVDNFLVAAGFPLSVKDAAIRYGRSLPPSSEPVLKIPGKTVYDTPDPDKPVLDPQQTPVP